jgi:hypothetical protein
MKKLKKANATKTEINGTELVQVLFKRPLNSEMGADILATAVLLQKKLERDISLLHSVNYNEIIGLTGEGVAVNEVLNYIDVIYGD